MGLLGGSRRWVGAGLPLARVARGGSPWRAWLGLRGLGGGGGGGGGRVSGMERRGMSTDPLWMDPHDRRRRQEEEEAFRQRQNRTVLSYLAAVVVGMAGLSYASVPLYRLFCQVSGFGGTTQEASSEKIEKMVPIKDRVIKVTFNADVHATLNWNFRPQQTEIYVVPGETALAFYKAKNPTDKPIIGVSTYNVVPFEAGQYFNKIQCFCFEEQRLNPHEEVDMPVFFYIDPEIDENPSLLNVNLITLSYTFYEAKEGSNLALPGFK